MRQPSSELLSISALQTIPRQTFSFALHQIRHRDRHGFQIVFPSVVFKNLDTQLLVSTGTHTFKYHPWPGMIGQTANDSIPASPTWTHDGERQTHVQRQPFHNPNNI